MLVIAHRGANKEAFENSYSAFDKAVEAGADRIELDVQLTSDDELVVVHDDLLAHATGENRRVSTSTRADIAKLKLRNGEAIPFLADVIDRYLPQIELNIEIKPPSAQAAEMVARLIKGRSDADKVIVSSFLPEPLLHLADHHPFVKIACLWGDVFRWRDCAFFAPVNFMARCRTKIFHPWTSYLTENVMDQARARGWIVYPWVGMKGEDRDKEDLWTYLTALGVDGLCTNHPRELRQWLKRREEHDQQRHPKT